MIIKDIGLKNIFLISLFRKLKGIFIILNIIEKIFLKKSMIIKFVLIINLLIMVMYNRMPIMIAKNINKRISPLL